tara:strand:+ start:1138 stop:1542 length:405 start_codon:yes stop_codon:yes gene_type:complete
MAIESARDFSSFLDATTGHGVTGTYFETGKLFDNFTFIDSLLGFIDDGGTSVLLNLIIDQPYISIGGESISVEGFQPTAIIKSTDAPDITQGDKLVVNAITTNKGNTITPETTFFIKTIEPDNTGFISVVLEKS